MIDNFKKYKNWLAVLLLYFIALPSAAMAAESWTKKYFEKLEIASGVTSGVGYEKVGADTLAAKVGAGISVVRSEFQGFVETVDSFISLAHIF